MAVNLSQETKDFLNSYKSLLQKNDLAGMFKRTRSQDLQREVAEFLLSVGVDIFNYLVKIPDKLLNNSEEIKDIKIGGTVEVVGREAFANSSVISVSFDDGVEVIDSRAFYGCRSLSKVDLGSVKVIKDGAFTDCNNLRKVYLPESVTVMGREAWPKDVILISGPRKKKSLRFHKSELQWYREHLILEKKDQKVSGNPADQLDVEVRSEEQE